MKKPKHKILVEYIEKIVLTSPLYVKKVYTWMNHEGVNLFEMREVEQEFFKENKIYARNDINNGESKIENTSSNKKDEEDSKNFIIPAQQYKPMILSACNKIKKRTLDDKDYEKRLRWLKHILNLNDVEFNIVRLYAYIKRSNVLNCFLNDIFESRRSFRNTFIITDFPEVLATSEEKICHALSNKGKLIRSGLFSTTERDYGLSNKIYEILRTPIKSQEEMKQLLIGKREQGEITLNEFTFLEDIPQKLHSLLKNAIKQKEKGINILLYGAPGTGKTEFAKSIASSLRENIYTICDGEENDNEPTRKERLSNLKMADFVLSKSKGILLLDEAEDLFSINLFGEQGVSKVFMNRLLENNIHPIIWTTNNIKCMDPAYIRRFTLLVEFKEPDEKIRKNIWEKAVKKHKLNINPEEIHQLSTEYNVPPAIITSVVKNTKLIEGSVEDIKANLNMFEAALGGNYLKSDKPSNSFNPALLNTDINLEKLADRLVSMKNTNFSLCLYGAPGTGKSAYARYIAEKLHLPVVEKKASDLLGKYVGESEKNIAAAFAEARRKGALLIFDEADSFLQDRKSAVRSWETTQVNEMLTQMEHSKYPFICTTNLMNKLDQASLRRFTFKVKYNFLAPSQIVLAFEHFFGKTITENEVRQLSSLCPGDFTVVKKKSSILGVDTPSELIQMLSEEMNIKNTEQSTRKIGFV